MKHVFRSVIERVWSPMMSLSVRGHALCVDASHHMARGVHFATPVTHFASSSAMEKTINRNASLQLEAVPMDEAMR